MSIIIKSGTSGALAAVTTDGELSTAADNQAYNGTAWEKARTANAAGNTTGAGVPAAGILGHDGTTYRRVKTGATGDVAVAITNPNAAAAGIYAGITATGALNVALDPLPIFADAFEGGVLDTTTRWALSGSVNATLTNSNLLINPDVTANATCAITTQPAFVLSASTAIGVGITIEAAVTLGNHRFWGFGLPPSTPGTAAAPLQDAIGFEVDTAGVLRASVYSAGTRISSQVMTRPTDGLQHIYVVLARGDVAFFYMDQFDVPNAVAYVSPAVKTLPLRLSSLNSASVTVATPTMIASGLSVLDPGRTTTGLADGTYPWRKAKIDATGALTGVSRPADLTVSATAASGGIATATLPAAGAGLYHYITAIEIIRYAAAIIVGSSTPNTVTTTNLPGSLAWTCSSAANAAGIITDRLAENYSGAPLRSAAANTATTIVGPATLSVVWRINVHYYTAP